MKTNLEIINPETDSEFYDLISKSQIGFYKSLDDTFLYFNRHVVENYVYDYEKVADEIYKKLHYIERVDNPVKDINDSKNEILNIINSNSEVEYLNKEKSCREEPNNKEKIHREEKTYKEEPNNKERIYKEEKTYKEDINNKERIHKEEPNNKERIYKEDINNQEEQNKDQIIREEKTYKEEKIHREEPNNKEKTYKEEPNKDQIIREEKICKEDINKDQIIKEDQLNRKEMSNSNITDNTTYNFSEATRLIEKLHLSKNNPDILNRPIKSLLLDYDGTLVPLRNNPDECFLPEDIKDLLLNLNKYIKVVICTGRKKEDMDKFVPKEIEVYAEHVSFVRKNGKWTELRGPINFDLEYKIANFYVNRTPGSTLERKNNGFVFHYRNCEDFIGQSQAKKLYTDLIKISDNIKLGNNIVEFRCTSKKDIFKYYDKDLMICGDDITDEDMFDRNKGITIKVGGSRETTKAEYCVKDEKKMIEVLQKLYKKVSSK